MSVWGHAPRAVHVSCKKKRTAQKGTTVVAPYLRVGLRHLETVTWAASRGSTSSLFIQSCLSLSFLGSVYFFPSCFFLSHHYFPSASPPLRRLTHLTAIVSQATPKHQLIAPQVNPHILLEKPTDVLSMNHSTGSKCTEQRLTENRFTFYTRFSTFFPAGAASSTDRFTVTAVAVFLEKPRSIPGILVWVNTYRRDFQGTGACANI
ncbi:hypothetical protein BDW62DRAFT_6243 [Aspergillus aurantiobrunneus]